MQLTTTQILMIEDDEQDAELVQCFLDDMPLLPLTLQHRSTLMEGIEFLQEMDSIDLVLLDLTLSDTQGLDTFYQVHHAFPQKPLIILSGDSNQAVAEEALQGGAQDFLVKGTFDSTSLCYSIQHALEIQKYHLELELQNHTLEALSAQLELARSEIKKLETLDPLTKVHNRTGFDAVFLSEWKRLQREEQPLALILCELDPNETQRDLVSQAVKDQLLQQIAEVILNVLKRPADKVARYDQEQFMILLPHTDLLGATFIVEAIRVQIQGLRMDDSSVKDHDPITLSFGITGHIPHPPEAPSLLLEAAHQALAKAQTRGRNQIKWQSIGDIKSELYSRQTLHWVGKLHQALRENLFQLYAQPIQSLATAREIEGYDVLLRMSDQSGRVFAPELFLPMIEQYDFMAQIDQWVIEHLLLEHTKILSQQKFEAMYFIKLSAATCRSSNLSKFVRQQLHLYDFPARQLGFEISTSAAIKFLPSTLMLAQSLKALGCQIVLDDIGVDFRTFRQLKGMNADYVKITGMLIEGFTTDPILYGILDSINRVAGLMSLKTIAGGVDSSITLSALYELGVDLAQGSSIQRAVPLHQLKRRQPSSLPG